MKKIFLIISMFICNIAANAQYHIEDKFINDKNDTVSILIKTELVTMSLLNRTETNAIDTVFYISRDFEKFIFIKFFFNKESYTLYYNDNYNSKLFLSKDIIFDEFGNIIQDIVEFKQVE